MKKHLPLVLQSMVSVALLAWIFWQPELRRDAWRILTEADGRWALAGLAVAGVGALLGIVRWAVFLRMLGIPLDPWNTLRIGFVGLFFNSFLVGAVGGDAVKAVWLAARGANKTAALLSVVLDRMSGLGALIFCTLVFLLARLNWLRQSPVVAGVTQFVFLYLAAVVALMVVSFLLSARGITNRLPENLPGRKTLVEFTEAYRQFVADWPRTLLASGLSVIILLAYFATFYCSARAFGVVLPVGDFFALMPAVDIISALPVSVGGFGVREQLFVTLLGQLAGTPAAQAALVSLGGALLTMSWGLFGLVLLPAARQADRPS
jgi:hypothetical protein